MSTYRPARIRGSHSITASAWQIVGGRRWSLVLLREISPRPRREIACAICGERSRVGIGHSDECWWYVHHPAAKPPAWKVCPRCGRNSGGYLSPDGCCVECANLSSPPPENVREGDAR